MASLHRRGEKWEVRWRAGGKQHSKIIARYDDARRFRTQIDSELDRGAYIDRHGARITLSEYGAGWLAGLTTDISSRDAAELRWRVHVEPALGHCQIGQLAARPSLIQSFIAGLQRQQLAPSTIKEIAKTLSGCLGAAVTDRLVASNPCAGLQLPRIPERRLIPWETGRVAAVRAELPAHYQATADAGAGLGMRQGEVFGLAVEDISFLGRVVHVHRQVRLIAGKHLVFSPPKWGRERDIPLPESVSLRLSAHLAAHPAVTVTLPWIQPGGKPVSARLLFTSLRGGAVNKNSYNHGWRDALDDAKVPRGRENGFHALRHHFASVLLSEGVDIRALSEYLGHHDPGFTLCVYTHLMPSAPDRMRAAIDAAMGAQLGVRNVFAPRAPSALPRSSEQ